MRLHGIITTTRQKDTASLMYNPTALAASGATATTAGTLAYTGFEGSHYAVAGAALIFAGLALAKIAPRVKGAKK